MQASLLAKQFLVGNEAYVVIVVGVGSNISDSDRQLYSEYARSLKDRLSEYSRPVPRINYQTPGLIHYAVIERTGSFRVFTERAVNAVDEEEIKSYKRVASIAASYAAKSLFGGNQIAIWNERDYQFGYEIVFKKQDKTKLFIPPTFEESSNAMLFSKMTNKMFGDSNVPVYEVISISLGTIRTECILRFHNEIIAKYQQTLKSLQ